MGGTPGRAPGSRLARLWRERGVWDGPEARVASGTTSAWRCATLPARLNEEPPSSPWRRLGAMTVLPLLLLTTTVALAQSAPSGLPVGLGAGRAAAEALLLLLSGLASACQAALGSLSEWRLRQLWEGREEGNGALSLVERDPQRYVS